MPGKSTTRTSPTTLTYNGTTHTDPTEIANALNDHYITIGHKTSTTIPHHLKQEEERSNQPEDNKQPKFTLQHVTTEQVTDYMKQINPNKANDIYKIQPAIIKHLTPYLAPLITPLFNQSIDENEYPDSLKYTKLIELYKSGDTTLPINYRPISLLPIIAKLLDTIINNQLMTYLLKNNLISPTQYAFRPHSNTNIALQTIINNIHKQKSNQPTLAIYIDLSKAYDTVSHPKLLQKLQTEFNFSPGTINYFSSYFRNRQQSTHTQNATSSTSTITHGIPQGSTLSTTLFLLYINNIITTVPQSTVYTYADDTTLVITARDMPGLQQRAQEDLEKLIKYFHSLNLVPNATKTNYTLFTKASADSPPLEITMCDGLYDPELEQTKCAKLLGIYIQDNLKHETTIKNIVRKLQHTIYLFRYATTMLTTQYMRRLYYTHVYPHLIGDITIWGTQNTSKLYILPLVRTQKKIIRILCRQPPRTHTGPLMQKLNLLNLEHLYTLRTCIEMHPYVYPTGYVNRPNNDHIYITVTDVHTHNTRYSAGHIFTPNPYKYSTLQPTNHYIAHLELKHTDIWNTLPTTLRAITSLPTFKETLQNYLLKVQSETYNLTMSHGHHLV